MAATGHKRPFRREAAYGGDRNVSAITTNHATITRDVIAPAVILAFSLGVNGRSIAEYKSKWATPKHVTGI